jgi:hypothetical protein
MTRRDSGMSCRQVRELLPLSVDGDLDSVREALVARHLASCPACRERAGLDCELAERLAAFSPAADLAARGAALRSRVMGQVEKEHRWWPWRRMALRLGNAATWLMVSAVAAALVLAIAVTWRPLAERAWPAAAPATEATQAMPGRLVLYHSGQGDELAPDRGVFAPLAAEVERALAGVRPAAAAVGDPAQEAERIKAQQVAIEAVYPAPGVRAGGDGPYTKVLIPLDAPESEQGLTILLGNDGYTRAAATDAGEALEMLRRILGVRQPEADPPEFGAALDLFALPPSAGSYRVSPDGQWVLYMVPYESRWGMRLEARATASAEVVRLEVDGEVELPGESQLAWFPDSRRVLVATPGEQGRLLIATLDGQMQTLARAPQGSLGYREVAISPDGWQIACTVLHANVPLSLGRAAVEVIDADGTGRRQIVAPEGSVSRLAYATGPGGANLFYFQDGKTYTVGADHAPAPALPQPVAEGMRGVAWSPGNTLALWLSEPDDEDGRAELYLGAWPVAREPTLVARGVDTRSVAWAGSDEWFVYSQGGALYLAPSAGSATHRRLTAAGERADTPVWAPGQGLLYRARRDDGGYVLRLLPLAGSAAPTPTPPPPGPAPTGLAGVIDAIAAMLNERAGDLGAVIDCLRAWQALAGEQPYREADLDGDGRPEILLLVTEPPKQTGLMSAGKAGALVVLQRAGEGYALADSRSADAAMNIAIREVRDLTGDGCPEVVWTYEECGAHTCALNVLVLAYSDGRLRDLMPEPANMFYADLEIEDVDGDGRWELMLHGGTIGSVGAGPVQTRTEIYAYDGQAYHLSETVYDPSTVRVHVLYDGDRALRAGNLQAAVELYRRAATDTTLEETGFTEAEAERHTLAAFAYYRLLTAQAALGDGEGAQQTLDALRAGYADHPCLPLAEAFWSAWQPQGDLGAGCAAATAYADGHPEVIKAFGYYGYGNPAYTVEDLCLLDEAGGL